MITPEELQDIEDLYSGDSATDTGGKVDRLIAEVRRLLKIEEAAKHLHGQVDWWVSSKMSISGGIVQTNNALGEALKE